VVHTSCMSSLIGSRESIQVPISLTHAEVCCPWNSVSAMNTLRIAEFSDTVVYPRLRVIRTNWA
jgi:hypothetical protein